jgi:low temperature requirement protein LtrA
VRPDAGLTVIIALGESIVAVGIGAAGVSLTPSIVAAALLGFVIAALWWAYFDAYASARNRQLPEARGAEARATHTCPLHRGCAARSSPTT